MPTTEKLSDHLFLDREEIIENWTERNGPKAFCHPDVAATFPKQEEMTDEIELTHHRNNAIKLAFYGCLAMVLSGAACWLWEVVR